MDEDLERFRELVEHSPDVVFEADANARILWVSPSVQRVTGYAPEHLVGHYLTEFVAVDDLEQLPTRAERLLAGEELLFTSTLRDANGATRFARVHVAPLRDETGRVTRSVGIVRDIHDETIAQQELARSEEHYRMLAEHVLDVVMLLDRDFHVEWVSPSVEAVLGWRPDELVGRFVQTLVHPDDWEIRRAIRERLADAASPQPALLVKARTQRGEYRWMSNRPTAVRAADGSISKIVIAWSDVEELVRTREDARRARDRLRVTLDTLFDPHALLSAVRDSAGSITDFAVVEVNDAACRMQGLSREEFVGASVRSLADAATGDQLVALYSKVVDTGHALVLDDYPLPSLVHGGTERRFDLRAMKLDEMVSFSWRDATERHESQERLSHLATHDPLTDLANRAAVIDETTRALIAARRSGRAVGVLMLDIDHFKSVNDELGHGVGDQLLRAVAHRLNRAVRGGDLVARLGGDEFVVVMRDLDDSREAIRVGQRIVEEFRSPVVAAGHELRATASLGVTVSNDHSATEDLLREADDALYRAKESGRDRYSVFSDDLREAATARVQLEAELRPALDLGELDIHYQPEIDLTTGTVSAVEALLRWNHPSGEVLAAHRFIDLAEDIGLMVDAGGWVVREACRQVARWNAMRPGVPLTLRLNASKQQLADPALPEVFARALADSGLEPDQLCVEINEAALLRAGTVVRENLGALRHLGVHLAMDNFGTGYAALGSLRDHPVEGVKIDRSLVAGLVDDPAARRLVSGIVALARPLSLDVSAEGVETPAQAGVLRRLGCRGAQGFLFSAAATPAEIDELLHRSFLDLLGDEPINSVS